MILVTLNDFRTFPDVPDQTIEADYVIIKPTSVQVFRGKETDTFVQTPYYYPPTGYETTAWYHIESDRHYKDLCICHS